MFRDIILLSPGFQQPRVGKVQGWSVSLLLASAVLERFSVRLKASNYKRLGHGTSENDTFSVSV